MIVDVDELRVALSKKAHYAGSMGASQRWWMYLDEIDAVIAALEYDAWQPADAEEGYSSHDR